MTDNNFLLDFGREVCGNLSTAASREWLVTNGIGGFASGTIAGALTRRYHGLLIAALKPPLGRTLLVSKLDETATYIGRDYPLFTNRWADGVIEPSGFRNIERFHLEGTTPVWTFACGDALLKKRIWMQLGENTTYVQYTMRRGNSPLSLAGKILVNHRDHHGGTLGDGEFQIDPLPNGLRVVAFDGAAPFFILCEDTQLIAKQEWFRNFALNVEQYRGFRGLEDHLLVGEFHKKLQTGEELTFVLTTEPAPNLDGTSAYLERRDYERALVSSLKEQYGPDQPIIERLALAADQFIVKRGTPSDPEGYSIIAGYHWFGDWGRDTMISLPGLTLPTKRYEVARQILRTYARFVDQGMLPNRFPTDDETPEYNTVDATLWYFESIRAYHAATGDDNLVSELIPVLKEIVEWHQRGTRYHIHVDSEDGLLYAGEPGVQLTWMDAKVGDWVVTPRIGKPVEINALWYNALRIMADFALLLRKNPEPYTDLAEQVKKQFERFWYQAGNYCYDVIDGPDGDDQSLRPNQLLAVSLPHSPLTNKHQKAVLDVCAYQLLTSHGLRSLNPDDSAYIGHYGGDQVQRDGAYHQGTLWSWLIGPFVQAHLRVYNDPQLARSFLLPLVHHLADAGLGTVSEIFDGDPPFTPRGCIAQAWGVAELLRGWQPET